MGCSPLSAGVYTVIHIVTAEGAKIIADDFDDADGHTILSFAQAQAKVKERRAKIAVDAAVAELPNDPARVVVDALSKMLSRAATRTSNRSGSTGSGTRGPH